MRSTDIDHRIEAVASKQHGAFNRQQAFAAGATDRFVQRRLKGGDWARNLPGVYVLAASPGTWFRQCKVAELSVPGSAVAVRSAAALHELSGFRRGRVELAIPANASTRHTTATLHRFSGILTCDVSGIGTTTIAQTLFDLATCVASLRVERALDDALASKRLRMEELSERQQFYAGSGRTGIPVMDALIAERATDAWEPPATDLEAALYALLARLPGPPLIVRQAPFPWRSPRPGRVDSYLPRCRLIVEADGRRWHTRVADFDNDRWRDNEAVAHGERVQRLTWTHLTTFADETLDLLQRTMSVLDAA